RARVRVGRLLAVLGRIGRQNSNQTERAPAHESLVRPNTTGTYHPRLTPLAPTTKTSTDANLPKGTHARSLASTWPRASATAARQARARRRARLKVVSDDPDSDGPAD